MRGSLSFAGSGRLTWTLSNGISTGWTIKNLDQHKQSQAKIRRRAKAARKTQGEANENQSDNPIC